MRNSLAGRNGLRLQEMVMTLRSSILQTGVAMSLVFCVSAALPAGGGGGAGGGSGGTTATPVDPDFQAGEAAVKRKDWTEAISRMNVVIEREPRNADAWNYLGYAYRQSGDMDKSFSHYERALQINPDHRNAHEYMGEAYLQVGKLAEAEVHLKALDKLCFFPCEQYSELKEKIAQYKQQQAAR
jgi:cytochrome c-type biogenesis protein CcmH/NrfG